MRQDGSSTRQLAAEDRLRLGAQRHRVAVVARREVERLEALDAGGARERAGLAGGEVIALGGLVAIGVEEERLAEEDVGAARQRADAFEVAAAEQRVDDVGDLLAAGRDQQVGRAARRA